MHDGTAAEFFRLIKRSIEQHFDRNGWQWSAHDSLLLDWCVLNMEADHAS